MSNRLKVCLMGSNQAGVVGALTILSKGHSIIAAVGYSEDFCKLLSLLEIPLYESITNNDFIDKLSVADVLFSVHGKEIVKLDLLRLPKLGCVNLHPYLYKYKGANPVGRAFQDKEFKASVGAHIMEEAIDEGKVLVEEFIDVSGANSCDEIYNKLYPIYSMVMLKVLDNLKGDYIKGG